MCIINGVDIGYGSNKLLQDVHMHLEKGKVVCLWGRNGSGKTTFLRTLAGLTEPLKGKIPMLSRDVAMVNQFRPQVPNLTVKEYLSFGIGEKVDKDYFNVSSLYHEPVAQLSDGQFKLVAISRQLQKGTDCLILDEPTAFLDIYAKRKLAEKLEEIKKDKIVLLVSHDIKFIQSVGDEFWEIKNKKLIPAQPEEL